MPTDLVFFAPRKHNSARRFFYRASSSGVAAHFDRQVAIQTGLYELIERDAFCATWYSKRSAEKISDECLPDQLRSRMSYWRSAGYNVSLLNITLDGPPVVLAMIWSESKRPALFFGAGCRSSFIEAADRAFSEAELMGITWHFRRPRRGMVISDIKDIEDHGLFYLDPKNLVHLEWLLQAETGKIIPEDFCGDMSIFDPIVVDVTPKGNESGLNVIRVLSEKLMPINFGYGTEHYGHKRMKVLGFKWKMEYPSTPHFFA